ncbi:MAG: hypothetical protein INR65_00490 [Gluconacetobacter diazotrophicus]|nr:hypothetical protein [Gluconacetobacter diazotrophicus]
MDSDSSTRRPASPRGSGLNRPVARIGCTVRAGTGIEPGRTGSGPRAPGPAEPVTSGGSSTCIVTGIRAQPYGGGPSP